MGGNPTSVAQGWGAGAAVLCAHKGDGTSGLRFASSYFIREGQGRGGAEAGREWCWAGCERSTAQAQNPYQLGLRGKPCVDPGSWGGLAPPVPWCPGPPSPPPPPLPLPPSPLLLLVGGKTRRPVACEAAGRAGGPCWLPSGTERCHAGFAQRVLRRWAWGWAGVSGFKGGPLTEPPTGPNPCPSLRVARRRRRSRRRDAGPVRVLCPYGRGALPVALVWRGRGDSLLPAPARLSVWCS